MINILAGQLKGMKLKVPSRGTRPTNIMLKRRVFDQYINWQDYIFIDLCAGTGSMGIEALSRGCNKVYVIEENYHSYKVLVENVNIARSRVRSGEILEIKNNFFKFMSDFQEGLETRQSIWFLDPPYEKHELYNNFLAGFSNMSANSQLWIESDTLKGVSEQDIVKHCVYKHRKTFTQGTKFITCFTGEKR